MYASIMVACVYIVGENSWLPNNTSWWIFLTIVVAFMLLLLALAMGAQLTFGLLDWFISNEVKKEWRAILLLRLTRRLATKDQIAKNTRT